MAIINSVSWDDFVTGVHIKEYLKHYPMYSTCPPYKRRDNYYMGNLLIIWQNPKYEKNALLLQLHYYDNYFPKPIFHAYQKELRLLKRNLKVSKNLKEFCFHYITGTLLGYRPSSIKGYYVKTADYRIFNQEYPKFKKICNDWIKYMLNDSKMFREYYETYKNKIKKLSV